jgi:hypothetical protein
MPTPCRCAKEVASSAKYDRDTRRVHQRRQDGDGQRGHSDTRVAFGAETLSYVPSTARTEGAEERQCCNREWSTKSHYLNPPCEKEQATGTPLSWKVGPRRGSDQMVARVPRW